MTRSRPSSETPALQIASKWTAGNRIVPIIGAGFSADSGVPVLTDIVIYLALLQKYATTLEYRFKSKVTHGLFRVIQSVVTSNSKSVRSYVRQHNWPDRFDLYFELTKLATDKSVCDVFKESLRDIS